MLDGSIARVTPNVMTQCDLLLAAFMPVAAVLRLASADASTLATPSYDVNATWRWPAMPMHPALSCAPALPQVTSVQPRPSWAGACLHDRQVLARLAGLREQVPHSLTVYLNAGHAALHPPKGRLHMPAELLRRPRHDAWVVLGAVREVAHQRVRFAAARLPVAHDAGVVAGQDCLAHARAAGEHAALAGVGCQDLVEVHAAALPARPPELQLPRARARQAGQQGRPAGRHVPPGRLQGLDADQHAARPGCLRRQPSRLAGGGPGGAHLQRCCAPASAGMRHRSAHRGGATAGT